MLIFDGSHLLSRARFMSPNVSWDMYAFIFCTSLMKTVKTFQDKDVIVVWDKGKSARRTRVYSGYKERPPCTPDEEKELKEYGKAREWLHTSLPTMTFQSMMVPGLEGDDIAFWLVTEKIPNLFAEARKVLGGPNYLISEDIDWLQILCEHWNQYLPIKEKVITHKERMEQYGNRLRFIYRKALLGDASDKIPKCYGLGPSKVDYYLDKLLNNESIVDKSAVSLNLQEFIASGQFSTNVELIDFSLLSRGERRKLHIEYDKSKELQAKDVTLLDWIDLAKEINSQKMIHFGDYLQW